MMENVDHNILFQRHLSEELKFSRGISHHKGEPVLSLSPESAK